MEGKSNGLSKAAKRRLKLKEARIGAKAQKDGFGKYLNDPTHNKFLGKSPAVITGQQDWLNSVRKIVKEANIHGLGNPTTNEYRFALNKIKDQLGKTVPAVQDINVTDFAKLISVDDPIDVIRTGASVISHLYQQPPVKKFIDHLAAKGIKKVRSFFKSKLSLTEETHLGGRSMESVNLKYVFGGLTESIKTVSDPIDIPMPVYTNQTSGRITLNCSATGTGIWMIRSYGALVSSGETSRDRNWFVWNNTTYDPEDLEPAILSAHSGPLWSSLGLIGRYKPVGLEVTVQPMSSLTESQGTYICGMITRNGDEEKELGIDEALSFEVASQIPYTVNSDMRTVNTVRTVPTGNTWEAAPSSGSVKSWGMFFLVVSGAAPSASINLKWSLGFSIQPTAAGLTLLRGSIPEMGNYTLEFIDYLRVTYPDIVTWEPKRIVDLYQRYLKCGSDSYSKLIKC